MHIPDGYLGPQTYLPAFAVMAGLWSAGIAKLKTTLRLKQVPLLALGAAFSFVIMMFNVPIPGGSTGHAVGAVLLAILFGPWAAMIVVSLALIVQALLFGDGGITAIGANCFNMAVVCPFVGWWIYRTISGSSPMQSKRRWVAGAIAGWLGLTVAALATGVEFGLQPLIAHDSAGRALYCPFGLNIAVPAMVLSHMLAFGVVEGIVTALVIVYFQRSAPDILAQDAVIAGKQPVLIPRIALVLVMLVLLSPLGLIIPAHFHAGSAWGEWSSQEIQRITAKFSPSHQGYVPPGLSQAEQHGWHAPLPGYALPGDANAQPAMLQRSYILAGVVGVMLIGLLSLIIMRIFARKDDEKSPASVTCLSADGMAVPAMHSTGGTPVPPRGAHRTHHNIVRKAVSNFARLLEEMLANEAIAEQPGLLQRIDPRAKVIGLIGLIVIATLVRHLTTLAIVYLLCVVLAVVSAIPARRMLRLWLAIPLFSAAFMLPALLNIVTPGHAVLTLWHFARAHAGHQQYPATLSITDDGIFVSTRFILRTVVCVTLALLLTTSTRTHRLFRGLRALGAPMLFVMLLSMMTRYLTVFVRAAEEIHLAKISRSIAMAGIRREQAWVAAGMGALFRRTQTMGDAVHLAMISRGYTGEVYLLDDSHWQWRDWVFLLIAAGVGAGMVMLG